MELPQELFFFIFSLLNHTDRTQCRLVCQQWQTYLDRSELLFETLSCRHKDQLDYAIQFFENNKRLANKVKALHIDMAASLSVDTLIRQIELFPHMQHVELYFDPTSILSSRKYVAPAEISRYRPATITQSWSKLKSIAETSTCMYTTSLLHTTQPFLHLNHLWLNFASVGNNCRSRASEYLITGLSNAPSLLFMYIMYGCFNTTQLDRLHYACSQLKELAMIKTAFIMLPTEQYVPFQTVSLGYQPIPAPSITKVVFSDAYLSHGVPLLEYMSHKYTGAIELVCLQHSRDTMVRSNYTGDRDAVFAIARTCQSLERFDTNLIRLTTDVMLAFEPTKVNFDSLDAYPFTPNWLEQFDTFSNTRFRHTLRQCELDYPTTKELLSLARFTHLTEVTLIHDLAQETPVSLNKMIGQHQHLVKLCIMGFHVSVDCMDPIETHIKNLCILDAVFEGEDQDYNCPVLAFCSRLRLEDLHLSGEIASVKVMPYLDLRQHTQLSRVDVYFEACYYIQLIENNTTKWLHIDLGSDSDDGTERYELDHDPTIDNPDLWYMTVELNSFPGFYYSSSQPLFYEESYSTYY
ncbi:uncharacterized protein B0P05DRAFT_583718 [Gilbertella persicaria]|uniref:uncharacterized protein n=1 Tax=Gilbertella persicaria TaxID=101096 RepID=UPI0022209689|nr:uncharacterized protein B0P05DRAFT_583718 [Gilbertella persicaria]KAI8091193.1 hypothetical protein B0P05DRAFT_583718 [Gilbertella persicaria]